MNDQRSLKAIWQIFLLVGSLLWAPIWGHWHNVEHGVLRVHSVSTDAHIHHDHGDAHVDTLREQGSDPLGHSAGSDLCQVLDHLAHADHLIASSAAWAMPRLSAQPSIFNARASVDHERWSRPQVRAPPALI
jgi:hypothetical protein